MFSKPFTKILAVFIYDKWCKDSMRLEDHFEDLKEKLDENPVLFLTMDYSNHASKHHARLLADALGIRRLIRYYRETGYILLIDSKRKRLIKKLSAELSITDMERMIIKCL